MEKVKGVLSVVTTIAVILAVLASVVLGAGRIASKGPYGSIEKVAFQNARQSYAFPDRFILQDAQLSDDRIDDVWVDIDKVEVLIDEDAKGTLLSTKPTLSNLVYGSKFYYKASSVVIWVQNEAEKRAWEKYLEKRIEASGNKKIVPQKVTP